jgi:hypothetical protein
MKRGRDASIAQPAGLSRLLEQLKRLRVPSISSEEANALLGPLVLDCLKLCSDSTLGDILWNFGWRGEAFTSPVNLFGLSTALSKYRWVRVQVSSLFPLFLWRWPSGEAIGAVEGA